MEIRVQDQAESEKSYKGGITLQVTLDLDDLAQLEKEAARALELERGLPAEARTELANEDDQIYIADFIKARATNDELEAYNIMPVAIPHVKTAGLSSGSPYTCYVHVYPRREIGLTSLDPVELKTNRVAKPGFSAQAAQDGGDVEFIDDEKVLRMNMVERLDTELTELEMRALGEEYQIWFEKELAHRHIEPESYRLAHGLTEEQYELMMARTAISNAHWNYVLDAVYVGMGATVTEDELLAEFEEQFPGHSAELLELHELRNNLYMTVEKVRRAQALQWLRDNVIK